MDSAHSRSRTRTYEGMAFPLAQSKLAEDLSNSRAINTILSEVVQGLDVRPVSPCDAHNVRVAKVHGAHRSSMHHITAYPEALGICIINCALYHACIAG